METFVRIYIFIGTPIVSIYYGFNWGFSTFATAEIGGKLVASLIALVVVGILWLVAGVIVYALFALPGIRRRNREKREARALWARSGSLSTKNAASNVEERYRIKREGLAQGKAPERITQDQLEKIARDADAEKEQLRMNIRDARPLPPPD